MLSYKREVESQRRVLRERSYRSEERKVFVFTVSQKVVPKRQFAEVIALPDESIIVTQIQSQSGLLKNNNINKVPWCDPCFMTLCQCNLFKCNKNNQNNQVDNEVDAQDYETPHFKYSNEDPYDNEDRCIQDFCEALRKTIFCMFLCPYTYCFSP